MNTAAARAAGRSFTVDEGLDPDWRGPLARFGLVGKAVFHLVIGVSVWRLATGSGSGSEASSTGAVRWIADQPYGTAALWVLAGSLVSLAVWRALVAAAGDPVDEDAPLHRVAFAVQAVVYGGLAVLCASTARSGSAGSSTGGPGSPGGGHDGTGQASDTIFALPLGRWLVFLIGCVIMTIAVYLAVVHAIDGRFVRRLRVGEQSAAASIGRVGYGLRSVAFLLVGYIVADAGLTYDPQQAEGLSGALRQVADESWGTPMLFTVAVGFVTYGVYCVFESVLRRAA